MRPALTAYPDAAAFLAAAGPALYQWEPQNNLPLGRAELCLAGLTPFASAFFGFEEFDRYPLAAVFTEPQSLCLSYSDPAQPDRISDVAEWLRPKLPHVRDIVGPSEEARRFTEAWTGRDAPDPVHNMRVHVLHTVEFLDATRGRIRPAQIEDRALAAEWIFNFKNETLHNASQEAATAQADLLIGNGTLYFLVDAEPVAMAARVRKTRHCSTIGAVYTPVPHRGKGYATALVGLLSQQLLEAGDRCTSLYTDLANPTSNAIYARIGYRPLYDAASYRFEETNPPD